MDQELKRRNRNLVFGILGVMTLTAIMPWAYAPAFKHVCGLLGLPYNQDKPLDVLLKTAENGIGKARANQSMSLVTFMGVSGELPIDVEPLQRQKWCRIGELTEVTYRLTNLTDRQLDYKAMHMLLPAGDPSFQLIKCFCDNHRVLKPHEVAEFPLTFRLVRKVEGDAGLTVNYTIFAYRDGNKKDANVGAAN